MRLNHGTPPIVIVWYFFMVPSQLNSRLGFINPGLALYQEGLRSEVAIGVSPWSYSIGEKSGGLLGEDDSWAFRTCHQRIVASSICSQPVSQDVKVLAVQSFSMSKPIYLSRRSLDRYGFRLGAQKNRWLIVDTKNCQHPYRLVWKNGYPIPLVNHRSGLQLGWK